MLKKPILLSIMLFIGTLASGQSLISISPNHGNINQTLTTTVTASGFQFTLASAPTIWDTYLEQGGTQIFPNYIVVIDDDHFDANWTLNPGTPPGLYNLVYWPQLWPWGWQTNLPNAFTITDTCNIARTPLNGAVCQGDSVKLSFAAASSYQWKLNGVNIPGATQQNYYAKIGGTYTVTATGSGCAVPIGPTSVTIHALPPATIVPSATQNLCPGQSVVLQANTGGGLTYKWKKNGAYISNATQTLLTVKDSGNYKVEVTNTNGCTALSASTKVNNTSMPTAVLASQPGITVGKDASVNTYNPTINYATDVELNALAWTINGTPLTTRSFLQFDLTSIPPGSVIYSAELNLYFDSTSTSGNHTQYGNNPAYILRVTSPWVENTINWNNQPTSTITNYVYLPASTSASQDYLHIDVKTLVRTMVDTPSVNYGFLLKLVTEGHYRALLFGSSDNPNSSRRPKLVVKYFPPVTASNGLTFCSGDSTKLQTSTGPYTYQWKKNGGNIIGATSSYYTAKTTGVYTVKVTNSTGCTIISPGKTVTVNTLPTATITPDGPTTFCAGDSVVLKGTYGTSLVYQWKKNNINIIGAISRKYTAKTAGSYKVKVTNIYGCTKISSAVNVTVPCREGEELPGENTFSIQAYPNPSSGDFNFRLVNGSDEKVQIRIYDMIGRLVNDLEFDNSSDIVVSGIELPGMYKAEVIQGSYIKVISLIKTE